MAKTLLFDVKNEFVDLLQASPDFGDVQVSYGHPGADELADEAIWIGETEAWDQDWATLGHQQRKETFDLVVRFVASRGGQDVHEAEDRIAEMLEYAQTVVVDQTNFADLRNAQGRQLTSLILTPGELTPFIGNDGRVAVITAHLQGKGRI